MPYGRRTYRRRRHTRRRRTRPNVKQVQFPSVSNMSVGQAARYAAKGVGMLKGIINSELKRADLAFTANQSSTLSIQCFNQIAQGDDVNGRQGNSILAKYFLYKYNVTINSAATSSLFRVTCFVDTENQGATPANLFTTNTAPESLVAHVNPDNTQRYTILFDDHIVLSAQGPQNVYRQHYIPLNFHIRYTGTGSAITDVNKNSIFVQLQSSEATNSPAITYAGRLAYYDN